MLAIAEVIPLEAAVISNSIRFRSQYELKPPDSIIYSSVLHNLRLASGQSGCFITRDSDFHDHDIVESLFAFDCTVLHNFRDGYRYVDRFVTAGSKE